MSVINPDEWDRIRTAVAQHSVAAWSNDVLAVLALLDLARHGTVQWFPDTDPVDVPWARFARNTPEWVRCVDASHHAPGKLTASKTYRVVNVDGPYVAITNDAGGLEWFRSKRFVPASADEATVTIDVPVAWARWAAAKPWVPDGTRMWPGPSVETFVTDACREALTKAGLL